MTTINPSTHGSGVTTTSSQPRPAAADTTGDATATSRRGLVRSIPRWVWAVSVLAGLVHMAPYWQAASQTPDGWTYTANLSLSPDVMQYRVWMRQTQEEGVFVSNRFTTEPNEPHLPVPLYWSIGRFSSVTGVTPEWTYAWLGGVLAVVFGLLLFVIVRHFMPGPRATAWVYGTLLIGGGLGGYIKLIEQWEWARGFAFVNSLLFRPLTGEGRTALFENYRGNYIVQALFDTHFLLFWVMSAIAVMALYLTVRRFSYIRLATTAALFVFGTFLHVYEGITLLCIAFGALFMCWRKGLPGRTALITALVCAAAVGSCLIALVLQFRMSGAATPDWRGLNVALSVLLLAYPLAWALIAWGGIRYWLSAGIDEAFLAGWAMGCLTLIAAGPFFPYPDRGTMTLQIPLFIIAGSIWFARRSRAGVIGAAVVALLLAATPVWLADTWLTRTTFKAHETHKWMSPDHVALAKYLADNSSANDVLLASDVALRWLAPDYRGRHYAGHFFLTTNYARKQERLRAFHTTMNPDEQIAFLNEYGVTWLYVDRAQSSDRLAELHGLQAVAMTPVGTLYRYAGGTRISSLPPAP